MKQIQRRYALLFWLGAGVLIATILVNRLFASGLVNYDVLYQRVVKSFHVTADIKTWRAIYILLVRCLETVGIGIIIKKGDRPIFVYLLLFLCGAGAGLAIVLMTWNCGVMGLPICLMSWLPHYLFYIPAWGVVVLPVFYGYEIRRSRYYSLTIGCMALGIVSEIIVNPWLMAFF